MSPRTSLDLNRVKEDFFPKAIKIASGIASSFILFISSSEKSTNRKAAILKISAPAIIASREVNIAGYDAIVDQSNQQNPYNHLSNYTKYI